jgi:bifunctional non-homologous end joining protein LigD
VIVWDRGVWIPQEDPAKAYAKGKLKFELQGEKLSGLWNLVRTHMPGKKENWFLIKHQDSAARPQDDYDVLSAEPDSVLSERTLISKPKLAAEQAKPVQKARPNRATASGTLTGARKPTACATQAGTGDAGRQRRKGSGVTRSSSTVTGSWRASTRRGATVHAQWP